MQTFSNAIQEAFEYLVVHFRATQSKARIDEIRKRYPRAYEKWTEDEDDSLRLFFNQGKDQKAIAEELQRKPICGVQFVLEQLD